MKEYLKNSSEVLEELSSDVSGLSNEEAEKRLNENGKNKLAEGKKETLIMRFLKQLAEPMTIVLLIAAAISGIVEILEQTAPVDMIIILAVVLLNAILGVVQESKAEAALEALEKKLKQIEDFSTVEGFVRRLFGLGERKLTSKETKFVEQWAQENYPHTMIELAYEISVNNTGAPSMPYINKTLTNWREAGYRTTEEIVKSIDKYRQQKNDKKDALERKIDDPIEAAILSSSRSRAQKRLKENNN